MPDKTYYLIVRISQI